MTGITLVFLVSACARSNAPPVVDPLDPVVAQLRKENVALEQRLADLEAERDRLRAKVDAQSPDAEPEAAVALAAASPEPASSPSEELPVVKLLPTQATSTSFVTSESPQNIAEEEDAPRPILRAYGEEEGEVIHGGEASSPRSASSPAPASRKSTSTTARTSP